MRKKTLLLFTVILLSANFAFGAGEPCTKEMAGKTACVAGELMKCNKEFSASTHEFWYEWHAVSDTGQPFEIYLNKEYKQSLGFTPAKCSDSKAAEKKP